MEEARSDAGSEGPGALRRWADAGPRHHYSLERAAAPGVNGVPRVRRVPTGELGTLEGAELAACGRVTAPGASAIQFWVLIAPEAQRPLNAAQRTIAKPTDWECRVWGMRWHGLQTPDQYRHTALTNRGFRLTFL